MFIIVACSHNSHNHGVDDGHSHDNNSVVSDLTDREIVSLTLYSENLEVFAEFQLLYAGHSSDFLIHITRLNSDYSAFTSGPIQIILTINGHKQVGNAEKTKTDGIYKLKLRPEKTGVGSLTFEIGGNSDTEKLSSDHVHVYKEGDHTHNHTSESAGLVHFTKEQAWKCDFNIMKIEPAEFPNVVKTSGEFLPLPGEKHNVVAKTQGIVLFSTRNLVQGKYVKKGEEMFTLSGKGLADNNILVRFNESETNFKLSKSRYFRHKTLNEEKVISDKQLLESENQYINDSILYYSLKETVGNEGMKILAPRGGYIHELNVSEGQFVEAGTLMATISTNKVMLLKADVPQQYFNVLQKITTTNFRPAYTDRVYTMEELSGKLIARGASVAENNHFMPVYFEVRNDGTLLEGAFAEFYLKTNPEPGHIVIPVTSLVEEQDNYYVYVQLSGEEYKKRPVKILASDRINVSIASGLSLGERIVCEGAMLIKTASSSGIPAHNHQH